MKKNNLLLILPLSISACTYTQANNTLGNDFIKPNEVVTKTVQTPLPQPKIRASYGYEDDPTVIKAYHEFTQTGKMSHIQSKGFMTYPYDGHTHFMVVCEPLHLCMVQLEQGENINNIDMGDAANWLVSTSLVGTPDNGAYQIAIKPKQQDIATDMVVTTSKRTYHFGLVSQVGKSYHMVNFYYPLESLREIASMSQALHSKNISLAEPKLSSIDADKLNFNYQVKGNKPLWRPIRIFDDGHKTFIELPSITEKIDLPVFYLKQANGTELVNYRYQKPYFIVDGLFKSGVLVSGKGKQQSRVTINNINLRG